MGRDPALGKQLPPTLAANRAAKTDDVDREHQALFMIFDARQR
jgi:hypothetical protein